MQDLKYLLGTGDKIISQQLKKSQLLEPESNYVKDLADVGKEFRSLVLRFNNIDKINFKGLEDMMTGGVNEEQAVLSVF